MSEDNEKKGGFVRYLAQAWLVLVLAVCFGTALAVVEKFTRPRLEQNVRNRIAEQVRDIFGPDAALGELVTVEAKAAVWSRPKKIDCYPALRDGRLVGWGVLAEGQGYDTLLLLLGLNAKMDVLKGYRVIKSAETPGIGDKIKKPKEPEPGQKYFHQQFEGQWTGRKLALVPADTSTGATPSGKIAGISGATISSKGVVTIVNEHVEAVRGQAEALRMAAAKAGTPVAEAAPHKTTLPHHGSGRAAGASGGH